LLIIINQTEIGDRRRTRKRREDLNNFTKIVSLGPIEKNEKIDLIFDRQTRKIVNLNEIKIENNEDQDMVKSFGNKSVRFALTYSIVVISIVLILGVIALFITRIWK